MFPYTTIVWPFCVHDWLAAPLTHDCTTTLAPFVLVGAVRHVVLLAPGLMVCPVLGGGVVVPLPDPVVSAHFWFVPPVQVQICIYARWDVI